MRRRTGSTDASVFATPPNHLPCPSTAQQPFPLVAVAVSAIASPPCLLSSPLYSRVCRGGEEYSATPPPPLACTSSTESIAPHLHSASPMESTLCSRTHTLPSAAWCYKAYSTMSSPCLTQFTPILHTPAHEPTRVTVPQKALPCTFGGCGCRSLAMGRLSHTCPAETTAATQRAVKAHSHSHPADRRWCMSNAGVQP
jgi:hypothetical protein